MIDLPLPQIAELLNRGFTDYFVPLEFNAERLLHMIAGDGIFASASRVVLREGEPAGIALISRRGWTSRLAGMAIVPEQRGRGVGRFLVHELMNEARARNDRAMVLEVIEDNRPAVRLYERSGFRAQRRLLSFVWREPEPDMAAHVPAPATGEPQRAARPGDAQRRAGAMRDADALHDAEVLREIDILEVATRLTAHGPADLPWQISGASLALVAPPNRAYQLGPAKAVITDPEVPQITLRAIVVDPTARREGHALRMVRALMAAHAGRSWRVPAFCPEEIGGLFARAGFERDGITQLQMSAALESSPAGS
jgi:ribosomal protein S18 acetylase RimI-like enzyme